MDVRTRGAYCPTAGAIVPMHDELCDWCGKPHAGEYAWHGRPLGWVRVNVWGTPRDLINADEFCPDCEREVPGHYSNCPTRQA